MMAIDVHIHTRGTEDGNKILKAMDQVGLERVVLFSVPPHRSEEAKAQDKPHQVVLDTIADLVKVDPERLIGFAWIEPTLPDAVDAVTYAFEQKTLRGVKMIPNHWYPADERAQACYAKINEYGKPMLFHTGILWGTSDTSQYCRPAFYEIMLHYPKIRFAMAHMSWPWTDECFAVCGKFRAAGGYKVENWRVYADITSGAPRIWKVDAMRKGLAYMGDTQFVYGSDCFEAENPEALRHNLDMDRDILRECGCSAETMERILVTNAEKWLGIA
jgi:predicted TIM-barrel fold metal-dependent hydrolase